MEIKSSIIKVYELFSSVIDENYQKFISDEKSDKLINQFISNLEKRGINQYSIGSNFLFEWFCFSYEVWITSNNRPKVLKLENLIGKSSIDRWYSKDIEHYQYFYRENILNKYPKITLSKVCSLLEKSEYVCEKVLSIEDNERARFFNKENGLPHCMQMTSLYNNKSEYCGKCNKMKTCIEILKGTNKRLAIERKLIRL